MWSKHKANLFKKVNDVYMAMKDEYGTYETKKLILHWLYEIKDSIISTTDIK
jgi:hypothetical protein